MNEAFERLLVEYADGDLDAAGCARVDSELARSPEASGFLDEYREDLIRRLEEKKFVQRIGDSEIGDDVQTSRKNITCRELLQRSKGIVLIHQFSSS